MFPFMRMLHETADAFEICSAPCVAAYSIVLSRGPSFAIFLSCKKSNLEQREIFGPFYRVRL